MASIQQANQLIKMCFDGSKHLKHVMSNEQINKMTMIEDRFPLAKLPVCGGCEGLAMWSPGMTATCTKCGTITQKPVTYATYLANGFDIDQTGEMAKKILEQREIILPDYARLEGRK